MNINKKQLSTINILTPSKQLKELLIIGGMFLFMIIIDSLKKVKPEALSEVSDNPASVIPNNQLALSILLTGSSLIYKNQMVLMLLALIVHPTEALSTLKKIGNLEVRESNQKSLSKQIKSGSDLTQDNLKTFVKACEEGNTNLANQLIKDGVDFNKPLKDGFTALMAASAKGRQDVVKLLVAAGAKLPDDLDRYPLIKKVKTILDIEYKDIEKNKLEYGLEHNNIYFIKKALKENPKSILKAEHLFSAIESGNVNVVRYILNKNEPLKNAVGINKYTPLMFAAEKGNHKIVELLLDKKVDVDLKDIHNQTALMFAAAEDNEKIVKLLLDKKADVNLKDINDQTALMFAASKGNKKIVKLLIDAEADLDLKNINNHTALMSATENNHIESIKLLLDANAKVNSQDKEGVTALIRAVTKGYKDIVEQLLEAGAKKNIQDKLGWTALMFAAQKDNSDLVKQLLEAGANVDLQNNDGYTALMFATENSHIESIKLLLAAGAGVDLKDSYNNTALMFAAHSKHIKSIELLLAAGADLNIQNFDNMNAIHVAVFSKNIKIIELLIKAGIKLTKSDLKHELIAGKIKEFAKLYNTEQGTATEKLFIFTKNNNVYLMKIAISDGANVNDINQESGLTPLLLAITTGNLNSIKLLIDHNANLNLATPKGQTPLLLAIAKGNLNSVKLLIDAGADVNLPITGGLSPLLFAIAKGNLDIVKLLIKSKADLNLPNTGRISALLFAIEQGNLDIVKLLIKSKADLNLANTEGQTPLLLAFKKGHLDIVKLLIDAGADVNWQNNNGETALHYSIWSESTQLTDLLLKSGANPNITTIKNKTALHLASDKLQVEQMALLIKSRANVNLKGIYTPLMYAINRYIDDISESKGTLDGVELLINAEADVNFKANGSLTPLIYAVRKHSNTCNLTTLIELLINSGANPKGLKKDQKTASDLTTDSTIKNFLELAEALYPTTIKLEIGKVDSKNYVLEILSELLVKEPNKCIGFIEKFKIDPNKVIDGEYLLYWAADSNNYDLIEYLIDQGADIDRVIKSLELAEDLELAEEIDIEILSKLKNITKYGVDGLRVLDILAEMHTKIPNPEEIIFMKVQTKHLLAECSKVATQLTPLLDNSSIQDLTFMSLITDYRVTATLMSVVIVTASVCWYLYQKLQEEIMKVKEFKGESELQRRRADTAEQRALNAEEETETLRRRAGDAEQRALRSEEETETLRRRANAVERQIRELSEKLKQKITQLTKNISALRVENKVLKTSLETLQTKLLGFENIQKDIDLIKEISSQKKSEELTRLYTELDRAFGSLCCPISLVLMKDPVRASDAQVYERESLTQWVEENKGGSVFGGDPIDMNNLQPQESYYDEKTTEIKKVIEQIKLLIQPDKKLEADLERLNPYPNPINGYEEVLVSYKGLLDIGSISDEQQLKVLYGLAFIATQAAERTKGSVSELGAEYEAARTARNFIQHPEKSESFIPKPCNKKLSTIIKALLKLSIPTNTVPDYVTINAGFRSLFPETKQSKENQLKEIIQQAKVLVTSYEESPPTTESGIRPNIERNLHESSSSSSSAGPAQSPSYTHTINLQSMTLEGIYLHLANLIFLMKDEENRYVKQLKKYSIFQRALRNAAAHGIQPLTDKEIEIFQNVISALEL